MTPDLHDRATNVALGVSVLFAGVSLSVVQTVVAIVAGMFSITGVCYAIRYYRLKIKALKKALDNAED